MKKFALSLFCGLAVSVTSAFAQQSEVSNSAFDDILFTEESEELTSLDSLVQPDVDFDQLEAKNSRSRSYTDSPDKTANSYSLKSNKKQKAVESNPWVPHFEHQSSFTAQKSFFFKTDIGLGLLYFSGVKGNFELKPRDLAEYASNSPMKGRFGYNRTPLYDFTFGYRFCPCLQVGFGYTHQGNVSVQTQPVPATPGPNRNLSFNQFVSNVSLDALTLRISTEGPWPVIWRNMVFNTYLGTGFGLGWQTWTANTLVNGSESFNRYASVTMPFKAKVSTNVVWGLDTGISGISLGSSNHFSMAAGIKFNLWGQARNMGLLKQQSGFKYGLFSPLRVRTLYQWAPYVSVRWNFPNGSLLKSKLHKKTKLSPMLTQMNVGLGLLSFSTVKGNLISIPNQNGLNNTAWQTARVTGGLGYNVTPLYEFLLQHRFSDWFQWGISYQNQGGITVKAPAVPAGALGTTMVGDYIQLSSYLNLNAIMGKAYVLFPILPFHRNINLTPYLGFGFGPAWQSWSRVLVVRTGFSNAQLKLLSGVQPVRQKISANCAVNLDLGLKVTSIHDSDYFSLTAGCKFNYWGQARNIGKQSQQGPYSLGLNTPFRIKKLYQWAPYLGVQWDFPNNYYGSKPYYLEGKSPKTWKPYCVSISSLQKERGLYTQLNVALGLLYFRGLQGNLSPQPASIYSAVSRDAPLKGRLSYNRTPLFEYVLGYRIFPRLQACLAYQHQGNVTVQTQVVHNFNDSEIINNSEYSQLSSDLLLDSLMVKAFTEYPKAVVWRSVAYTPYLGAGLGVGWQTWKRVFLNQPYTTVGEFNSDVTPFRQKVSANVVFGFDTGIRMQSPYPNTGLSASMGIKFNFWGQCRSVGQIQDQYYPKRGLSEPFKVLTVYQWAPYLGVQWAF